MSNEARFTIDARLNKNNLNWSNDKKTFTADIDSASPKGPSPGAITVTPAGINVDLSELTNPSICLITNLDQTNFVTYGIWDGTEFYPIGEVLPGEFWLIRLSRLLGTSIATGTGTGTADTGTYSLRIKANNANCNVVVEAFER